MNRSSGVTGVAAKRRMGEWDPGAGGTKISARGNGYHFPGWIAPDLSHACGLHRPGYDRSPASPNPAGWYIHGAAQNRRGTVLAVSHILGAPSSSPHRSRAFIRPLAHSPFRGHASSRPVVAICYLLSAICYWLLAIGYLAIALSATPSIRRQSHESALS